MDSPINVIMPGGSLRIEIDRTGLVRMTGPVKKVFEGVTTSLFQVSLKSNQPPAVSDLYGSQFPCIKQVKFKSPRSKKSIYQTLTRL